eukprot:15117418-Alexandrium_andersonii.AAC.1
MPKLGLMLVFPIGSAQCSLRQAEAQCGKRLRFFTGLGNETCGHPYIGPMMCTLPGPRPYASLPHR